MQGRKDIQPKMMYQVSLDSLVAKDNFYRQLDKDLDLSFIYKETACYYGSEGQESIDPVVFFKICMVGYMNNITSDRRLIEFCANRLDVRLYLKYDIDESLPWHSTISRTRQLYGEEVFLILFQKVLSLCVEKGMVRGRRQVIDSALIKANASLDSLVTKEVIADAAIYAGELNENSEFKITGPKQEDTPGKKTTSNKTHYSPTDPDAKISLKPGKACHLNYYGQIAVDDAHHVITGANGDFADQRDSQCLEKIATQTIENLNQNDMSVEQLLADTGYSSGEALRFVEENNIDAYIPNIGSYKHNREGFIYNQQLDRYECTRGNKAVLPFINTATEANGYTKKIYRSTIEKRKDCPFLNICAGKSKYKQIADSIDKPLYAKMHLKMQTTYGKRMAKIRGKTVEPVLGTLINFMGMKRVNARGIEQANKQVIMAALCYNLKKLLRFTYKKAKCLAIALSKKQKLIETLYFESMSGDLRDLGGKLNI
jgi:transposase